MSIPDYITRTERCSTCAFRPGTEANGDEWTQLKVRLCLDLGSAFHCHENGPPTPNGEEVLCKGFVDVMGGKVERGVYEDVPQWKKDLWTELLELMHEVEARADKGEKISEENGLGMLREAVRSVNERHGEGA